MLGDGEGVHVLESGEPVHEALVLPHGVALLPKDLEQQDFGLHLSLHAELRHLAQSGVDELHVTPPPHVGPDEHVHHLVERGLGLRLLGHALKQVVAHRHGLVPLLVIVVDELRGYRRPLGVRRAAVETSRRLRSVGRKKKKKIVS
ncbi:hypothetical protein EYF80_032692 [Liparis tanakae]|uniref:Uncharacterized protein n=1 Tax=Liparis tanakae TaxID=230148 RepID=A0A4Z2GU21_9TELE|nr:hypothetical protein EYF80_032692 [Liparis tanakae]